LEGLNASAVAVALMLFPERVQIREKKFGRPVCVTFTVTKGFTPNAELERVEQSVFPAPVPAEYVTATVGEVWFPTMF
jgi:hypothetical protein